MKAPDFYLNNYIADELRAAFDKEDVCISYSGDYEPETLNQVHNSCEILFVEEGEAEYQVNDTVYHVEKNTVLIIGATDRHKFTFTKLPYIRYGLTLMPSFLQSLPIVSGYMNVYQTQIPENAAKLVNLEPSVFQRMIKILWELRDEWESGEEGSDMVCALVMELTILLKRQLQMKSQESSGTYKAMNELKHYIDTHYQEDLSLSNLSKIFYLQPGTISKNFRQIWGKNINRYINSVRITNAVHILDKSDISITELAEMVGYENVNTFLRQFKEKMDVSPLQYRKRRQQAMERMHTREMFSRKERGEVYSIRITVNSIRNDGTTRKDPGNGGKPRKIKGFSELMKMGGTRIDTFFEKRAHFSEQKEKLSTLSTKRAGKPHKQRVPGSFLNWNE